MLRHEAPGALWIELEHDGWLEHFGFLHERKLYLDREADELRGEDRLHRRLRPSARPPLRPVRDPLPPGAVSALVARDKRSILIKAEGEETWWLRHDAASTR